MLASLLDHPTSHVIYELYEYIITNKSTDWLASVSEDVAGAGSFGIALRFPQLLTLPVL